MKEDRSIAAQFINLYSCCQNWCQKKIPSHLLLATLTLMCSCILNMSQAQTKIKGRVSDKNNLPIENATINIKNSTEGSVTDSAGNFVLTTNQKERITLIISSIGYENFEKSIEPRDGIVLVNAILQSMSKTLEPVSVTAGSFEASDKAKGASLTPMDAVTVAGNGGDIANALRTLPGAQQIGDQEGLFVRGGTSHETKQFIDGALLPVPNFSSVPGIIQPAHINPFLFKGILFNTGGYSALYGGALSSALILESVDLPDQTSASLHIFPTAQGMGFQRLSNEGRSSYGIDANYDNYGLYNKIVKQNYDYFHDPEFASLDANLRLHIGQKGLLKVYANYGYNHTGLISPSIDSVDLKSSFENKGSNLYTNIAYRQPLAKNWRIDAALAYNYNNQDIENHLLDQHNQIIRINYYPFSSENDTIKSNSNFAQARMVLTRFYSHHQALRFGVEHFYSNVDYDYNDTMSQFRNHLTAAFLETDIYITNNIAFKAGIRTEYSSLLNKTNLALRAGFAYRFEGGGQINFAYGIFYQEPEIIYLLYNKNLNFEQATHYVLNYQKKANNRFFRIEGFYKQYKDLITTVPDTANSGDGYAKGIELFFRDKRTFRHFDYWITYTYLDTKRKYLNYPYPIQPNFAAQHTASIAIKRYFPDLNFNANLSYSFATGRPFYDIQTTQDGKTSSIGDQGKTNNYSQMNLSFAYLFTMFPKWKNRDFSGIGFGINNVFGTRQIYNYNYSYNGLLKTPVPMAATRFYYIGLFMTFGIDRRDDFINDKL